MKFPMTDIHQHLLWGLDDGASSQAVMEAMLRQAHRQGICTVAATAHAAPGLSPFDMGRYAERLAQARDFCDREDLNLKLLPGAEIAWTDQTPMALRQGKVPALGNTDYVLLELWRDVSWHSASDAVNQLTRAGYCPVLAHPERYLAFLLSPKKALRFRKETGALLQVNAQTLLTPRGWLQRRLVEYLLREGVVDAVASDAHNCGDRPVNLEAAYNWLTIHTDEAYARRLTTFAGELI